MDHHSKKPGLTAGLFHYRGFGKFMSHLGNKVALRLKRGICSDAFKDSDFFVAERRWTVAVRLQPTDQ
jgi:hypothetical protein